MEKEKLFVKQYTRETEIGKQYGSLQVVDFIEHHVVDGKKIKARAIVKCLSCNCDLYETGHEYLVRPHNPIRSCGCLNPGYTSHGLRHHLYYNSCNSAINRCKPNYVGHEYYYDRGITCFWNIKTIANFIKYLENNLPKRQGNESLDRIDNDKGYEPGNLRWASKSEQTNNRRPNVTNHKFALLKKENDKLREKLLQAELKISQLEEELKSNFGDH